MKRVVMAVMSGLLLSCQGPAAVLAQEAAPRATATGGRDIIQQTASVTRISG